MLDRRLKHEEAKDLPSLRSAALAKGLPRISRGMLVGRNAE